ncbi:MAG: hypothetical protein QNK26_09855 [Moritella sp.]|uniref:hypothetical protein n=1 Tax=Moritella sp. TaxID=78556 RepID=UPI0029B5E3CC|nr:hypothetical protein [Moritella sp.]MDX2320882.1 hypothetical protein [Moritella sp.]
MPNTCQDNLSTANASLVQLTQSLDAMHIAQLASFAYGLPPLFLCREYLEQDEATAIKHCLQRLENGLNNQDFSVERLTELLTDRDYYDDYEARLRLGPEPK